MKYGLIQARKSHYPVFCDENYFGTSMPFKIVDVHSIIFARIIDIYNTVKPHKGLNNATPYEILTSYFSQSLCKQH